MASPVAPAELTSPFTVARGLLWTDRRTLDGSGYQRVTHGTRAPADLALDHGQLIRAVRSRLGAGPVLVGASAAWALGVALTEPDDPVHLLADSGVRRQRWVAPHRGAIDPAAVVQTALGSATSPARTAVDLARGFGATRPLSNHQRVACVDALIQGTSLTAARAREAVDAATRLHGLQTARRVIAAAVDGAESPKETELRLLVMADGLPVPAVQYVVRTEDGRFVARLDMAWPQRRVGLEYDGAHHRDFLRHSHDLARHNALRALHWDVLQVDAASLARPAPLLGQLTTLLHR